ncbi:MAG: cyclic nucleotide-binding domain-containing protein [Acidobacteriota bacterium]
MELISRKEKIKDGETIVDEGTWAYYAYVLKSGKAKVLKNVSDKRVLIGTLNKGSIFGEVAFLGGAKRTASVIADGDVEVDMIPRDSFFDALSQLPQDLRSKLNTLVSDLTFMDEVKGRLILSLHELQNARANIIDLDSFEREIEQIPELLRQVVVAFAKRHNASVEGCTKLAAQAEETVKAIESVSFR